MLVINNIIYLQLPKTGCTHIAKILKKYFQAKQYKKHQRIIPTIINKNSYIISSIRNPWDWYLSVWTFGCAKNGGTYSKLTKRNVTGLYNLKYPIRTLHSVFNEFFLKPVGVWKNLYSDSSDPEKFRKWIKMILNKKRKYDIYKKHGFSPITNYAGYMTYRYAFLFSKDLKKIYSKKYVGNFKKLKKFDKENNILDDIIHLENLENDLINILTKAGMKVNNKIMKKIYESSKTNKSKRPQPIYFYYDEETKELVKKNEKLIIDKYSYEFPN